MQTENELGSEVFGLYELADDGTILYLRPRSADGLHEAEHGVVGRDFFRDVFPCQNIDDLRRHFRRFITEDRPVDTFVFDGLFEQEIVRAKIFMTRAYENDNDHAGGIVIMDIRRAA
jgi:hypothetical protein